jgi:enoyl-CoA hydratase
MLMSGSRQGVITGSGLGGSVPFQFLHVEREGPVAYATLDRPPVNAVNLAMYHELRDFFSRVDEHLPGVRVIVFGGKGRHFCAGNELQEFLDLNPANSPGRMRLVRDTFNAVYDCPVPVIGAVHGMITGTGIGLAASCDILIAGESTRFATPEVSVGVMGGAKHLRRLVPEPVMRKMYLTADPVPVAELRGYGLVADVVADDKLNASARELAQRIARHSRPALRHAKEALNTIEFMDLKAGYEFEQRMTGHLSGYPDSLEARQAVWERRTPVYSDSAE